MLSQLGQQNVTTFEVRRDVNNQLTSPRGKPSEIDFLNGYVVRKGAELGIATPTNQALQVMVKLAQRSKELSRNS